MLARVYGLETIIVARAVETDIATTEVTSDISKFSIELDWALACSHVSLKVGSKTRETDMV